MEHFITCVLASRTIQSNAKSLKKRDQKWKSATFCGPELGTRYNSLFVTFVILIRDLCKHSGAICCQGV